jgi:glutaminyl-peptide cyclotransferase
VLLLLSTAGCAPALGKELGRERATPTPTEDTQLGAARLNVEILGVFPHDPGAFTQGLLWHEGWLYESTGIRGRSSLRQVDHETGAVARALALSPSNFAEGVALVGHQLIQLTWQEGIALVYDLSSFEQVGQFHYAGEGWGLCYDGQRLVMSDGSSRLTFRDAASFEIIGAVEVTLDGNPLDRLNELECVSDRVYANVWMTDRIVRVDPSSGRVDATIDASRLLAPSERAGADVLNGIAYLPERDSFLVTGKLWPKLFEVRFIEDSPR